MNPVLPLRAPSARSRETRHLAFRFALLFAATCGPTLAAPSLTLEPDRPDGLYQPGEKITWRAQVRDDADGTIKAASYVPKRAGAAVIGEGTVRFADGKAAIEGSLAEPGTILVELTAGSGGKTAPRALAGAAIAPEKIGVSSPCPDDFDTFWQAKIHELFAVPENAVLTSEESGKPGVQYWKITMDNIRGTHIQGQLARPTKEGRVPALLIVQWAGVYPLQKTWATDRAAEGWLVLNLNAHDLPIDRPPEFYKALSESALKDYTAIGNDDREKSYFLRMFLSAYRGVEYLAHRPDWDGRTLVVSGTSQGGLQTFVAAGLNPKVTGMMALVPAGCDDTGDLAGRRPGWPYWMSHAAGRDVAKVRDTARYYDAVNFATRVTCPALVGVGLIDVTSPPSGVYAAYNQLKGSKEMVVMPDSNHHGDGNAQAPYLRRSEALRRAWLTGKPDPLLAPRSNP